MQAITIGQLCRVVQGRLLEGNVLSRPVTSASTDSRGIAGDCVFFAIKGDRFDGHGFLAQAAAGGAVAAVVQELPAHVPPGLALIGVDNTRKALGRLARHARLQLGGKVIAVAGSNGKTTTKYLIHAALSGDLRGTRSPGSFNNDIGVPLTLLPAALGDDYVVVELGTNHPGEIAALSQIALPDIAVITSTGPEHLEFLGDLAGVRRENASIVGGLAADGLLVVNGDDRELLTVAGQMYRGSRVTFGFAPTNDLFATDVACDAAGTRFLLNGRTELRVPLLGKHTAANALAAVAVARRMGLDDDTITRALAVASGPEMRMQVQRCGTVTVLNDAYNANPASMRAALETLREMPVSGRRVAVLGDMRELGPSGQGYHREMGGVAAASRLHRLYCVGPDGALIAQGARDAGMKAADIECLADSTAAADQVPAVLCEGDTVLLKASHGVHLETVAHAIARRHAPAA